MISKISDDYLTNRNWLSDITSGQDVILCYTSALEYLQLFNGYIGEKNIDVYAKKPGVYDNINYRVLKSFRGIDAVKIGNVLCTTVNQTFNDMLGDFDNIDEQALIEGLSAYYHSNGKSFDGLRIKPGNMKRFNIVKDWAAEYYDD